MTKDLSFQEFLDQYTEVNLSMTYVGTKPIGIYLVNSTDLHFVNCDGCTDFKDSVAKVIDDIGCYINEREEKLTEAFYEDSKLDIAEVKEQVDNFVESVK